MEIIFPLIFKNSFLKNIKFNPFNVTLENGQPKIFKVSLAIFQYNA